MLSNKSWFAMALLSLFAATSSVVAEELGECRNANVLSGSMFSDVPWNSMYPIRLAGINVSPSGSGAPSGATNKVMCSCPDDVGLMIPGFTQSMYEPARLIEIVRQPDCMMSLGGADLDFTSGRQFGTTGTPAEQNAGESETPAFWHYHYYAYPLLMMLELVVANRCGDGFMSMDLLYLSELDPTWSDPELGFFANPESAIFANPISLAACVTDAAAAAVDKPIDSLFWCAGAWGGLYPLSGFISTKSSFATKTSLLATRSVAALHRRLLARQTMGNDALCSAPIFPTIPKTQYKMNMMYPVPERGQQRTVKMEQPNGTFKNTVVGTGGAHEIGQSALMWGEWRNIPSQEDAVYMLWRYNDCCMTFY